MDDMTPIRAGDDSACPFDVTLLLAIMGPAPADKRSYRIADLAHEFGVTLRSLRFYEKRGLLSPQRRNRTRIYSGGDRRRLKLIVLAKGLGFTLSEAEEIVAMTCEPSIGRQQLESMLDRFHEQRDNLLARRQEIDRSIEAMDLAEQLLRDQRELKNTVSAVAPLSPRDT